MVSATFLAWRRWLTRAAHSFADARLAVAPAFSAGSGFLRGSVLAPDTAPLVPLGIACVALGAVGTFVVSAVARASLAVSASDAAWLALWAGLRLVLLRLASPAELAEDPRLTAAWAGGLLPFALAWVAPLRVVAFGASAWLTFRALRTLAERRMSLALTGIAFGTQLAADVVVWVASSVALVAGYLLR